MSWLIYFLLKMVDIAASTVYSFHQLQRFGRPSFMAYWLALSEPKDIW
jgi:hypothetical protein